MRIQVLLLWARRIFLGFLILAIGLAIALGARTKSHFDAFTGDLKSGASGKIASDNAELLSKDVYLLLSLANLPILKQGLAMANLDFTPIKEELSAVVKVAPILAGSDRAKRYLIAFQNSAEARGTGGILGSFAVVELNKAKITVIRTGSNAVLQSLEEIPIKMPEEFKSLYRSDPAIWQNSNLSPHFPYGAKIWLALWKLQFGESLDGVIAVDPSALSYMLRATGPIKLPSGKVLTSENLVSETLSSAYKEYEKDNAARKQYLVTLINATFEQLLNGGFNKIKMANAIEQGVVENRILIYSRDGQVEGAIRKTRLAGFMDSASNNEFRAVVQNIDASKLDYYLDRSVSIRSLSCGAAAKVEISITVKNLVKNGKELPAYVLTRADKSKPKSVIAGQHRFMLFIYGPPETTLVSASRSSKSGSAGGVANERKRPILVANIDLAPGASERVSAVFTRGVGKLEYHFQPLVQKERLEVNDKCS